MLNPTEGVAIIALIGTLISLVWNARQQFTITHLNSDLRRYEEERKVLFSSLHARRIEVTTELHARLAQMDMAYQVSTVALHLSGEPSEEDRFQEAQKTSVKFFHYFQE